MTRARQGNLLERFNQETKITRLFLRKLEEMTPDARARILATVNAAVDVPAAEETGA